MNAKHILTALLASAIVVGTAVNLPAQEQKKPKTDQAEKKKSDVYPFRGKVASVDKAGKTITLQGKEKSRVIQITDQTKITKAGKAAKLDDATAGEDVGGQVRRTDDGKEVAVSLRIGPAPEGEAKGKKDQKKDEKK